MSQMAAEELGIPYDKVRTIIADTSSLGFNDITDGSRATFSSGHCHHRGGARCHQEHLRPGRQIWGIPPRTR